MKLGILILLISTLIACSEKGFQAANLNMTSVNQSGSSSTPAVKQPTAYDKLDLEGYVDGGSYDNTFAVNLDKPNNALIINLPIPAGPFTNLYVDIPDLKGAKIRTYYDSNNLPQVAVSVPLSYILGGVKNIPAARLPNGNALPAMPSGEAPSLAFGLNQNSENKVYLYIGVNAIGLYIENSYIPSYLGMTFPIKNKMKTKILGYFTLVPKSGNFNGGLFCSVPLPVEVSKIIDDHLSGVLQ